MFAEALRHELADTGVSLTTVYPGEIATSLHDHEKDRMPAWYRGGPQAAPAEGLAEKIVAAIEDDERAVYYPPLVRALGIVHGLNTKAGDALLRRLRGDSAAPRAADVSPAPAGAEARSAAAASAASRSRASSRNSREAGDSGAFARATKANVVVERVSERRPAQALGHAPAHGEQDPARDDRVPQPARGELQGRLDVLDVDLRLDGDADALGKLGELAAHGVLRAVARVGQDERHARERLDRDRRRTRAGIGRGVEDLLAHDRLDVESAVVDRQRDHPGLELARADGLDDLRGVQADDAHAHARMAAAELGDEVDPRVVARRAPRPEGGRAAAQLAHGDHRVARRLGRVQRSLGVRTQRVARLGRLQPAADALEEPHAELRLEPAHLLRQRRLGQVELLGGRRERAVAKGGEEVLELL